MDQRPIVISFTNSKGGVGKSAMCALFGSYLHYQGKKVVVVDGDIQGSILKKRNQCISDGQFPRDDDGAKSYKLLRADVTMFDALVEKLKSAIKTDRPEVILIDTPGGMSEALFAKVMLLSHYVVAPFNFEHANLMATTHFIRQFFKLKKVEGQQEGELNRQLILIPNRIVKIWGTKVEKEDWSRTLATFNSIAGCVTKEIPELKILSQWDTIDLYLQQWAAVGPAFDEIYPLLFKSEPPICKC